MILNKTAFPVTYLLQENEPFRQNIQELIEVCKENHIRLIFVEQPLLVNLESRFVIIHSKIMDFLREICKVEGIEFIELPEFEPDCFDDWVHLSPKGNNKLAKGIADYLGGKR